MDRKAVTLTSSSQEPNPDEPFLPPIENPQDPMMKQTYNSVRQQFGKVFTPLKVLSARLPYAFYEFTTKINELDNQLTIPRQTSVLIREQVARINVCLFCMDTSRFAAINFAKISEAKIDALPKYSSSPLFTDAERAALDYATELTRDKKVKPETFARLSRFYSERQICEIVYVIASEHLYNIGNIGLNIHSDMLCKIPQKQ